jgi:beta-phosphoglucomutase
MVVMKPIRELNIDDFEVATFDWDGTLVDSTDKYRQLDQVFVREYYGREENIEYLRDLFNELWGDGNDENFWEKYYLFFDKKFGGGDKSAKELAEARQKYLQAVQSKIEYKANADLVVKKLRENHTLKLALATASTTSDIDFISKQPQIRDKLGLSESFDLTLTFDDVKNKKPHPEIYNRVLGHFAVEPSAMVVIEDSWHGVVSAKAAGATVINKTDDASTGRQSEIDTMADFKIEHYDELLEVI